MNDKEIELLNLYLKQRRRKSVLIIGIIVFLIVTSVFMFLYVIKKPMSNNKLEYIEEVEKNTDIDIGNIINEIKESETSNNEEKQIIELSPEVENNAEEIKQNIDTTSKTKEENKIDSSKNKVQINTEKQDVITEKKDKPANKEFLFTDGYNMDNVTKAASDYLKSSNYPGECIPIKDNEGIYLGMKVIFY